MKPPIPFGIIEIKHSWPKSLDYIEHRFTLQVEHEPPSNSGYFWAEQFWFNNGDGGYFGIQTNGDIDGHRKKIAIFSIWKATGAIPSSVLGASAKSFGHEGSGFSCKIPMDWREGVTYLLKLQKSEPLDDAKSIYWEARITNSESGETLQIGQIAIPAEWGNLQEHSNFFVEYFRPVSTCEETPYQISSYSNPIMTTGSFVSPSSSSHRTYGRCAGIGKVSEVSSNVFRIETGAK